MVDKGVGIEPGTVLNGRYRVVGRLGEGAFGRVYLTEDQQEANTLRAVKELVVAHLTNAEEQRDAIAWFKREVSLLLTLEHPGIANIHGYWSSSRGAGHMYLVMDYIPGKSLAEIMPMEPGSLAIPRVVRWGLALCDVLHYLHTRTPPMVFRDVKPSNIMIDSRTDSPVLIDFGLARQIAPTGGTAVGTWGYVPFEQALGKAEPRSDIYALGAVLYALLSGRQPDIEYRNLWRSGIGLEAALLALFPPLATNAPTIPELLSHVVTCATSFQAEHRFPSAAAMASALRKVQAVVGILEEPVEGGTTMLSGRPQPVVPMHPAPEPPAVDSTPAPPRPEQIGVETVSTPLDPNATVPLPATPGRRPSPGGRLKTESARLAATGRLKTESARLAASGRLKTESARLAASGRLKTESARLVGSSRLRPTVGPFQTEPVAVASVPPLVVPAEALGLQARIGIKRPVKSDLEKNGAPTSLPIQDDQEEKGPLEAWSADDKQPPADKQPFAGSPSSTGEQPGRQIIAAVGASGLLTLEPLPLDSLETLPQMQPLDDPAAAEIMFEPLAPRETLLSLVGDSYVEPEESDIPVGLQPQPLPGIKRGIWPFRKAREAEVVPVLVPVPTSTPPRRVELIPSVVRVDVSGAAEFQSIGEALESVQPGAVIEVMPGVYEEDVVIDRPVEIVGIGRPDQIIIEAQDSSCVLMRTAGAIVRNLTLRSNLHAGKSHAYTVNVISGKLLLEDCIVLTASSLACVSVHGSDSSPIIRRCTLRNSIERALAVYDHAQVLVEQCDIQGATVPVRISAGATVTLRLSLVHGGRFGGVWVMDRASADIAECDIVDNGHHGVAVKQDSSASLSHCRVNRNGWSAVSIADVSHANIEHCDLAGNKHTAWDIEVVAKKNVFMVGNREL